MKKLPYYTLPINAFVRLCVLCTLFFFFCAFNICAQDKKSANDEWTVLLKQQNVEFMVKHQLSHFDQRHNTLFRLKNGTNKELVVTFKPSFLCENSDGFLDMSEVKVTLYPRQSATLLAFRPCFGAVPKDIKLSGIKIKDR